MRAAASFLCLAAALATVSCTDSPEHREYFYRNFGDSWTKYVPPHDSLEHFQLSPDGRQVCYLMKRGGKWMVGINGRHWDDFHGIYPAQPAGEPKVVLSPDGRHAGVIFQREAGWRPAGERGPKDTTRSGPQWFVEVERRVLGGFDGGFMPKLQFSPDGTAFGLVYQQRGEYYVLIVDTTFGPYARADFTFTAEGEVYIAYLEGSYIHVEQIGKI